MKALKKLLTTTYGILIVGYAVGSLIWLTAWTMNAVKGMHFDLTALKDMWNWMMGQMNGTHLINSWLNSDKGKQDGGVFDHEQGIENVGDATGDSK